MEIENVRGCVESAVSEFFGEKHYIDDSVDYCVSSREDWKGRSEIDDLCETIIEKIINVRIINNKIFIIEIFLIASDCIILKNFNVLKLIFL